MEKLKVGNEIYKIPTKFEELKLRQLIAVNNLMQKSKEVNIGELIAIVIEVDSSVIKHKISLAQVKKARQWLSFLFSKQIPDYPPVHTFELNGKNFKSFENLFNMSFEQFVDLEYYTKNSTGFDIIAKIASILYLQDGENYEAVQKVISDRQKEFLDMPVNIALGIYGFFLLLGEVFSKNTQTFSKPAAVKSQG